MMHLKEFLNN